jgi:hypothetical protein
MVGEEINKEDLLRGTTKPRLFGLSWKAESKPNPAGSSEGKTVYPCPCRCSERA